MEQPLCNYCSEPIPVEQLDRCWRKVTGWEKHRDQGGTNALALPVRHDIWMHAACMPLAKRGIPHGQGTLL